MKDLTCATIITDGERILMGHSTGNNFWDLPKGKREEGETPSQAAIRECYEEFGYPLILDKMIDKGQFKYNKKKDIHLFIYKVKEFPNLEDLHCDSTCSKFGKMLPEIDGYKIFDLKDSIDNMSKVMKNFFKANDVMEIIKES